MTRPHLRKAIANALAKQGYCLRAGEFVLPDGARDTLRGAHQMARAERVGRCRDFIHDVAPLVEKHLPDGAALKAEDISPVLIPVSPGSKWEALFRWWNLVWWSLPWEKAYGRQMRYVVWDKCHEAVIGLIGLQSPILSWTPRDRHMGIPSEARDYWVNQSLSAQRLGALPPYNGILGGKLVALTMATDKVRGDFRRKYRGKKTVLRGRELPANLLFITTTGAFGKSSVYNRLKFRGHPVAEFIGYSNGSGSFHIPNHLYERMIDFLRERGVDAARGYGNGPSRKMRLIERGMKMLGYRNGNRHSIRRAVYLFPLASNLGKMIAGQNTRPRWMRRTVPEVTDFWKERWMLPRLPRLGGDDAFLGFRGGDFVAGRIRSHPLAS